MKPFTRHSDLPPWVAFWVRLVYRLAGTLAMLAAAFLLLEWAGGHFFPGRPTRFLAEGKSNGEPAWIDNQYFPLRFFPERTARAPVPIAARQTPEAGTLRVCLLGGSEARGIPEPAFGFNPQPAFGLGRQLELMLQRRYPNHPVEVIQMVLEHGNSHVLREAARDLHRLKPDAVVVLAGNDEVAGPYGPATALGRFHPGGFLARGMILLSRTRLWQLCMAALNRQFPARADREAWRSQEPVTLKGRMALQDPRLNTIYRSFQRNLAAILQEAAKASPAVVVCTVPVNLRDCAPFSTSYLADETAAQRVRETLRMAQAAAAATNRTEAARLYAEAIRLHPTHADALFRAAQTELQEGHRAEASALFSRARDADALRLRADSRLNAIIRESGRDRPVSLLDVEDLFATHSPDGISGRELFFDHIHFNFEATHLLASALLNRLEFLHAFEPEPTGFAPDLETMASELLYQPWGRAAQLDAAIGQQLQPIFRRQLNHAENIARLKEEKQTCDSQVAAISQANTLAIFSRRLANRPDDAWLAARTAWQLLAANEPMRAETVALSAHRHWPHRVDLRALLALIRAVQGQAPRDGIAFLRGEADTGYFDIALSIGIGRELLRRMRPAAARPWFAYALERDPWNSEAIIALAETLFQLEGINRALSNRLREIERNPRNSLPWTVISLSEALRAAEEEEQAVALLQRAIERNPRNPLLWEEMAVLYTLQGDWKIALNCYRKSEEIAPHRYVRLFKSADAMFRLKQYGRANDQISRYLKYRPDDPEALALQAQIQAKLPTQPEPSPEEPAEEKSSRRFPWE